MSEDKVITLDFTDKKCEVAPFESPIPPSMMPNYMKMDISPSCKGQVSALCQQIPALANAGALKDAYIVKWPEGVPHQLVAFKDGSGYMSMIRGDEGKFVKHAALQPLEVQAIALTGFTAMSIATSQYFLAEINQKMAMISRSVDKILEFLYGDKKAELLAEISFAKYAYQNFAAIMEHGDQRAATIQSLQDARKTAIKDIEFYLADLYATVHSGSDADIEEVVDKAFQIRSCLELAMQLYMTGNLLEVYYSQNYDSRYLEYIEMDVSAYISKCEKQILSDFSALQMALQVAKPKLGKKLVKEPMRERIAAAIDYLSSKGQDEMKEQIHKGLYSAEQPAEYCICSDGTVYLKKA